MIRPCSSHVTFPFLVLLVPAFPANSLVGAPLQREIPYFVDAAGSEYDLEQEAKGLKSTRGLPPAEQLQATVRNNLRRMQRWRVYLRSDGTWAPDPNLGKQDYGEQHHPVEYVLPLGYRGAFQVAWGVPGAPPLQIVNDKIEIYIPASGVYETSSALALTTGTVASPKATSRGFLAESGEQNDLYGYYRTIEKFGDDSKEANDIYGFFKKDGDGARILAEYGDGHFKAAFKKVLLESALQRVDLQSTLLELKRLRYETPRIAPRTPFSPDFEAVYVLAQEGPIHSQTIRRMIGNGSRWAFNRE